MTKRVLPTHGALPAAGRLRPLLTLALGFLSLAPSWAQLRPIADAKLATKARADVGLLPSSGFVSAARAFVPSAPTHRTTTAIASTATGGNWSAATTWVGGVVPTATDDVTIAGGATVTLDVAAVAGSLTVAAGGTLATSATTNYSLQVGGSVTNNGTMALSASATVGSDLRFVGAGSVTFGGTGTTDLYTMSLAKSVLADVVDMNLPTLSVKGSTTTGTGFLLTLSTGTTPAADMTGTLKISGTAAITSRVFVTAAYAIPATGAFWLSNANYTVTGQTASATVSGQLRITAGTYAVGTAAGNSIGFATGSVYTQEGGTLTVAGRFGSFTSATAAASMTFNLSGGALNVSAVGNASGTPSFGVNGTTTISGGAINLVQRSTATTPLDYYAAGTYSFTGGTVNVGTAATATNFDFRIRGNFPNLTIDNTTNAKSALLAGQTNPFGTVLTTPGTTLNLNGFILLQLGSTITNNGTLTGTATSSRLYFQGSTAQSIGGTGTVTSPLLQLTFQNSGPGVTVNIPITVRNIAMFRGNVTNTNNLTVQATSTALAIISFGITSPTASAGNFDVAPTFDVAATGLYLIYNPELAARTTGVEVPASRALYFADFNNPQGITIAGGNLTVFGPSTTSSSIGLLAGIVTTSATSKLISGVTTSVMPAGSATAYVRGPFGATVNSATPVSRLFAVGDAAGFRPVVLGGITSTTDQTYTATVIAGATAGTTVSPLTNLNPTRYVRLENTANLPATATVQLSYGADDIIGAPATAVVAQAPTAAGAYASVGGAAATVPSTGIVSTLPITPGNDFFVLANTEGGTLATSTATGCAGATSGTLTLSGNATGSTVVKYQANTGSGFVDVPGTNTGTTYAFTNLTVTTTFQAVLLTSDGRTVTSAPVTVTVTPQTTATFSYAGSPFCKSNATNPTPTITGTAGGTFSSTTGLTIDATTGAITLGSSTAGTYTVTYTVAGACGSSSTQSITITNAPVASFSYAAGPYCVSGTTNPTVVLGTGATAGTFTSATGLTLNATTGAITLSSSAPGTYTVTNTIAAAGGCAATTATASITITAASTAGFSYATPGAGAACAGGTGTFAPTLAAGATAGTYSSTTGLTINATTGVISLASSTAGTYTITNTVAASGGCAAATSTTTFTVNPVPATPTLTTSGTPATGITLTSSAATGNQFYLNGVLIPGATAQTYLINSGTKNGSYTVVVTGTGGCTATSAAVNVTVTATTLAQAATSLTVYPNPTPDGQLTLALSGYREAVQLTISNTLGQRVQATTLPAAALSRPQSLDLSALPAGVYVLQARTASGGVEVRRIVRE